jgi:hypothetical protein
VLSLLACIQDWLAVLLSVDNGVSNVLDLALCANACLGLAVQLHVGCSSGAGVCGLVMTILAVSTAIGDISFLPMTSMESQKVRRPVERVLLQNAPIKLLHYLDAGATPLHCIRLWYH